MCVSPYFNIVCLPFVSDNWDNYYFFEAPSYWDNGAWMRHHNLDNKRYNTALTTEEIVQIGLAHRRWVIVPIIMGSKKKIIQIVEPKRLLFTSFVLPVLGNGYFYISSQNGLLAIFEQIRVEGRM